jgi:KDO2-lipid IV(A) lauroyltransferase
MLVLWLLVLLPQSVRNALGAMLGEASMRLSAKRRRIVATHIAKCFPDLSPVEQRRMARLHFRAASATLLGSSLVWWAGTKRLRRLVRFCGREHYDNALAAGRPVILLAPHFVALEVGGVFLAHERPIVSMYRRSPNALIEWFMVRSRLRFGGELFERDGSLMRLVKLVRKGLPFYYLPDRNPGDGSYVFAPFFGYPVATVDALGRIAQLARADVIPCATRLLPGGQGYEIIFRPPMQNFPTGNAVEDATRMNAEIEALVKEMPEQYMWTYKRFKLQPEGALPFYD